MMRRHCLAKEGDCTITLMKDSTKTSPRRVTIDDEGP